MCSGLRLVKKECRLKKESQMKSGKRQGQRAIKKNPMRLPVTPMPAAVCNSLLVPHISLHLLPVRLQLHPPSLSIWQARPPKPPTPFSQSKS